MKIIVIDNYDSFTYNLVQMLLSKRNKVTVKRNDEITLEEVRELKPDKILISPGPGKPEDSKVSLEIIKQLSKFIPVLGVCLGHQAIAVSFGGKVVKAPELLHGKSSEIIHDAKTIFNKVPQNFNAIRYHSLIVERETLPSDLIVSAQTGNGLIMGLRHITLPLEGIQFHPESILSENGKKIINNWLKS
jgi:anthranilate synthase/aminodeoxychorismate synthase-like glutamine amidotransferase